LSVVLAFLVFLPVFNPVSFFSGFGELAPLLGEDGEPVLLEATDDRGRPVLAPLIDETGEVVLTEATETVQIPLYDEDGEPLLDEDEMPVFETVTQTVMEPLLDDGGNPVMEEAVDEEGNYIYEPSLEDGQPVLDGEGNPVMVIKRVEVMQPVMAPVMIPKLTMVFDENVVARWKPLVLLTGRTASVDDFEPLSETSGRSLFWTAWNGAALVRLLNPYKSNSMVVSTLFVLYQTTAPFLAYGSFILVISSVLALARPKRKTFTGICLAASAVLALYSVTGLWAVIRINMGAAGLFEEAARRALLSLEDYLARENVSIDGFQFTVPAGLVVFTAASSCLLAACIAWMKGRLKHEPDETLLRDRKSKYGYAFTAPLTVGFFVIFLGILVNSLVYSFSSVNVSSNIITFVGLRNYSFVFNVDPTYLPMLVFTARDTAINTVVLVIFSMVIANILNQRMAGRALFRAVFFIPVILATGILAKADVNNYILTSVSTSIDMGDVAVDGTIQSLSRLKGLLMSVSFNEGVNSFIIGIVNNIYYVMNRSGVQILLFLASMQSISPSIYESAYIEGASGWECFWKITFPMLSPAIIVNTVYTVIDSMVRSDNVIMDAVYTKAFVASEFGIAGAMSWFYFGFVVALTGGVFFLVNRVFRDQFA